MLQSDQEAKPNSPEEAQSKFAMGATYAIKIINKQVLRPEEINIIHGESKILKSLVGVNNVVQFQNIFETDRFIVI